MHGRTLLWLLGAGLSLAGAVFAAAASYFAFRRSRLGWALALGAFFLAGALKLSRRMPTVTFVTRALSVARYTGGLAYGCLIRW